MAAPVIVALGMRSPTAAGIPFAVAGAVAFAWVSALALRLMAELGAERA